MMPFKQDESAETTLTKPVLGRRRWVKICTRIGLLFLPIVLVVIASGFLIRQPYFTVRPGEALGTESELSITCFKEGRCPSTHPSEGELYFTTAFIRQRPFLWEYFWLQTRSGIEMKREKKTDRTPRENIEINLAAMANAKETSVAVALQKLGYDAIGVEFVYVERVVSGSPAGGVLLRGDVLRRIEGTDIATTQDLLEVLKRFKPGQKIDVKVDRSDPETREFSTINLPLVLGDHPDRPGDPYVGINFGDRPFVKELDFDVEIKAAGVGGPSAGLAFTLAVLDYLTEGDLAGGKKIAVTGTINAGGLVGPVGSIPQKAAGVKKRGAEVFIIPNIDDEQLQKVEAVAGDELKIVQVGTLDEALAVLAEYGGNIDSVENFSPPS